MPRDDYDKVTGGLVWLLRVMFLVLCALALALAISLALVGFHRLASSLACAAPEGAGPAFPSFPGPACPVGAARDGRAGPPPLSEPSVGPSSEGRPACPEGTGALRPLALPAGAGVPMQVGTVQGCTPTPRGAAGFRHGEGVT